MSKTKPMESSPDNSKFVNKFLDDCKTKKKDIFFELEQDFVNELKKRYNISDKYSVYVFDDEQEKVRTELIKHSKKVKHELNLAYGKGYGIEVEAELGCFKLGNDYIVVYKREDKSYLGWILFTLDFTGLMEKYFPEKEIAELYNGIYTIEKTQGGMTLMRHKIDTSITPILNDSLLPKIKKEIKCFMEMKEFYKKNSFDHKRGILLYGDPGNGKCHGKGTKIIMHNGSIKNVEDVKIGDQLMGDDSTSRTVLSLGRGKEMMYKVVPVKGDTYTVNESHILSLKKRYTLNYTRLIKNVDISVKDYLKVNKNRYVGYKVPVNFDKKIVSLDPYFLGLWLGDGDSAGPQITSADIEIENYLYKFAPKYKLKVTKVEQENNKSYKYRLTKKEGYFYKSVGKENLLLEELRKYNLINNKHIPDIYLYNNRKNRLQILAGLLDSDGNKNCNCYEFSSSRKKLAEQVTYLARSLGFWAKQKNHIYNKKEYYKVHISGHTNTVPVLIERKKCAPRKQIKNVLHTSIVIEKIGTGNYYGFELDGNGRYLLGDFTVTHNTTFIKHLLSKMKAVSILCNINSEGQLDFLCDFLDDKKLDGLLKIIVLEDIDGMDPYKRSLLLNMIDGVFNLSNTIFIATTNFPSKLDTALVNRPSRIDSMYKIDAPNEKSRMQFLKLYFDDCTKAELTEGVELTKDFKGCYFKEIYLIKTFEKCSLVKAIETFKEKFELLKKLQEETNYVA